MHMKEYTSIDNSAFLKLVDEVFVNQNHFIITILGREPVESFKESCEKEGGVIKEHYELVKNMPLGKKISSKQELVNEIKLFQKYPVLHSKNINFKFHWDLYIWSSTIQLTYNSHFGQVKLAEDNTFQKILDVNENRNWLA